MVNYQFEKNARRNRRTALFFTIAFHVVLLGGLVITGDSDFEEYVPDVVQEWLGMETADEVIVSVPEDKKEIIRP